MGRRWVGLCSPLRALVGWPKRVMAGAPSLLEAGGQKLEARLCLALAQGLLEAGSASLEQRRRELASVAAGRSLPVEAQAACMALLALHPHLEAMEGLPPRETAGLQALGNNTMESFNRFVQALLADHDCVLSGAAIRCARVYFVYEEGVQPDGVGSGKLAV